MAPKISPRVLAFGGIIYIGTASATYLYLKATKPPLCSCSHDTSGSTFDRIAKDYDKNIDIDETLMGIKLLRRFLIRKAEGNVLEVSAGTGRNIPYYSTPAIHSLTMTDASREMLMRAHEKHIVAAGKAAAKKKDLPKVSFCLADIENLCLDPETSGQNDSQGSSRNQLDEETRFGPALRTLHQLPPAAYDTVVDTFGLCSCEDPVKALKEMAKAVRPGGKILLLEHGRGTWDLINKVLDSSADAHLDKWGCRWNRDIEAAVKEAGLVVESISRWHFGTTHVITARPSSKSNSCSINSS